MKMQNTLIASRQGPVKKVRTKAGSTVGKNELLVEISKV
jgi:biotin carboxyl carrier protein